MKKFYFIVVFLSGCASSPVETMPPASPETASTLRTWGLIEGEVGEWSAPRTTEVTNSK